ncbi:MAG: hypothetical protein WDM96_14050 [Lacunisphaera sp.]
MKSYAITSWKASNQAVDERKNLVSISGRAEGFFGWLLSKLKIGPIVSVAISADEVRFSQGSLQGSITRVIPLENICSTYYGYNKPWLEAVLIAVLLGWIFGIGIILAIIYYYLNKSLVLGFVEMSGGVHIIGFKRSIIEGQNIDETSAAYVTELTQALIDNRKSSRKAA